ncbi:MAG: NmrA family transcriptional regulator [Sphaerisporangium sp.]|jgi:uncharacterized protein YbjT (DUF2867 family)|nr:NmrA family transcriptional regulator [Sphaerisporangium sp.]
MANQKGPVLVIGATGQQGGAAVRELLARGWTVHALVRDTDKPGAQSLREAGAGLVTGDLDDPSSLRAAMSSVHGVFVVLTMMTGPRVTLDGVAAEVRRGKAVADIAKETGIGHLVYSSSSGADLHTKIPHVESKARIEEHIRALELPATVLRPAFFMDNFASLTRPVLADGELVVSLAVRPETRMRLIATRDIGAFAAIAFDQPERFLGRDIEIAGDDLTGSAIAGIFGRACDRPARFQQVPIEQLRAFDEEVAKMFQWLDNRAVEGLDFSTLREHHPGLMTLETWLHKTAWTPNPATGQRS